MSSTHDAGTRGDSTQEAAGAHDPGARGGAKPAADGAQIMELGYRHYDGVRRGLSGSIRSVATYSIRHTLGLGRPARHKIFPWLAVVIALIPGIVFVGIAIVLDFNVLEDEILPDYHEYYAYITTALFFYCAVVVPDILVPDRRNGMLQLYLSSPLQRWSYLASKAIAVSLTLAVLTVGPVLFLLVAYTIEGSGPDGLSEWAQIFLRIIAAGAAISAAFTAASLAAASLTDRRIFATIGVIVLLWSTSVLVPLVVEIAELDGRLFGLDLNGISEELTQRIYAADPPPQGLYGFDPAYERSQLSTVFVVAANLAWVTLGGLVVWWRYRRLAISR